MSRWSRASRSAQSGSTQQPSVPPQPSVQPQPSVPTQQGPETRERIPESQQKAQVQAEATPGLRGPLAGDPLALGMPSFIVGSVAFGMVLVGFVSPLGVGASLPIILAATAAGLFISAIWAMGLGQSAVAVVLGVLAGFWLSYGFLLLGLMHGWFGVGLLDLRSSQELFLTAWIVVFSMLTLATLRLALGFSAMIFLVDVALILVLVGVANTSTNWLMAGGAVVFLFAAVGIYIFFGTASVATGGKPFPLGRPVLRARS
jgi:succinate-acetate transporter protein